MIQSKLNSCKIYFSTHLLEISGMCMALGLVLVFIYTRAWFNYTSLMANFLFAIALILTLVDRKNKGYEKVYFGDRFIWIPLLIIVLFSLTTLINTEDIGLELFYVLYIGFMFLIYIVAKELGSRIFSLIVIASLINSLICIAEGFFDFSLIAENNDRVSGLTHNPDAIASFLAFSVLFYRGRLRWLLFIPLLAIYFTGSWVAVFSLSIVGLYILIRRKFDINWRTITVQLLIVLIVSLALMNFSALFGNNEDVWHKVTGGFDKRFDNYELAFNDIKLWGNGFQFGFNEEPSNVIHNVPIIIGYEFGIFAGLAWLWIMFYCLWKTNGQLRHLTMIVFFLSMGDCYLWRFNGMAPYFFVLIGIISGMKFEKDPFQEKTENKLKIIWSKMIFTGKRIVSEERGYIS